MIDSDIKNRILDLYQQANGMPRFYSFDQIPPKQLENAIDAYASSMRKDETAVFLFDETTRGNGKNGFLLSTRHLYIKNMWQNSVSLHLSEIQDMTVKHERALSTILLNTPSAVIEIDFSKAENEEQGTAFFNVLKETVDLLRPLAMERSFCGEDVPDSPVAAASRLSDTELSQKLRSLNVKKWIFNVLAVITVAPFVIGSFLYILFRDVFLSLMQIESLSVLDEYWYVFPLAFVLGLIWTLIASGYGTAKKTLISVQVVHDILENTFDLIAFRPKEYIDEEQLRKAQFRRWTDSDGRNFFVARYRGVQFTYSDIKISHDAGGRYSSPRPVFTGGWLILNLDKEVHPPLLVSEFSRASSDLRPELLSQNAAFNRQFTVLTAEPQMAFSILTPHFMDFFASEKQRTRGKWHLCFTGNHAHIAVGTDAKKGSKVAKWGLSRACKTIRNIPALRERVQSEIGFIKDVIDELLLNESLFDRESEK